MLLLAVETSTPSSSVALLDREGPVATATLTMPRRHGEFLGPAVEFCLAQAGRTVADLTGVAVGVGPGLYTGLRVGMAFGQALAQARNLPVVGLSGLDVMGFSARHTGRTIHAAIDARRGQVFWATYHRVPGGVQRDGDLQVGSLEELEAEIMSTGGHPTLIQTGVDDGGQGLDDARVDLAARVDRPPLAVDLGMLATPKFLREETVRPGELEAIYLRRVDAKIGWQARGRLQGGAMS